MKEGIKLRDGYYLSTYLYSDKLANVMDIKMRHNQNLSLWKKSKNSIELIHYWELERLTGLKQHSKTFFSTEELENIISGLIKQYGLSLKDIIEIWGTPGLDTDLCNNYSSTDLYGNISYHSISHLFSSLLFDSKKFYQDTIIGLAVDSGPDNVIEKDAYEKKLYAGSVVRNGDVDIFPIKSPGKLWSRAKKEFGMREGTLMALATASSSELINVSFEDFNMEDFSAREEAKQLFRKIKKIIDNIEDGDKGVFFNGYDERFSKEENKISMAMKVVQNVSNQIMEQNIDNIISKYKIKPEETILALSGGCALNCPTNSYLMEKYNFKGFIAPPCVNDAGLSLGIALYCFYKKSSGKLLNIDINNAYYGDRDESLEQTIKEESLEKYIKKTSKYNYNQIVKDIIQEPIVWFNGSAEIGPRALGNRSIIGDPRKEQTKEILNNIKEREWWRPVAPIILEEDGENYFKNFRPSPFMLLNYNLKPDKLAEVPAIAHLDGTSRVQSVTEESNYDIYNILIAFKAETGIPILCNTSLNDKGEPIINTIKEAFNFALRKKLKVIYVNGTRIELKNQNLYDKREVSPRYLHGMKTISEDYRKSLIKELNPNMLTQDVLIYYYDNPDLMNKYNILIQEDAISLTNIAREYIENYPLSFIRV